MKTRKILIFGGSFDPPHNIHIEMLNDAIKKINPTFTLIVPTYLSPFKKKHLFSYHERKKMIKMFIKNYGIKAKIYNFEYYNKKKTYTYMLIKNLKLIYPKSEIYFLLGTDSINTIKKWKRYKYLIKNLIFVVAKRKGIKIEKNAGIKSIILPKEYPNISSTQIRKEIFSGNFKNIPQLLRKSIDKKLKITKLLRKIKKMMSKERFNHTIETIKLATYLAWIYGADIKKAFIAAALHDIAKDIPIHKQIKIIKDCKIKIKNFSKVIKNAPQILHQWASRCIAEKQFNIKDKVILSAISKHTTASKKMSTMDKIIYLSDISAADRNFSEVKDIRKLLPINIDKAFEKAMNIKIKYVKRKKGYIYES